jgi:hypothetical protein
VESRAEGSDFQDKGEIPLHWCDIFPGRKHSSEQSSPSRKGRAERSIFTSFLVVLFTCPNKRLVLGVIFLSIESAVWLRPLMARIINTDEIHLSTELWRSATIIVTLSQLPPSPADCPKYDFLWTCSLALSISCFSLSHLSSFHSLGHSLILVPASNSYIYFQRASTLGPTIGSSKTLTSLSRLPMESTALQSQNGSS